MLKNIIIVVLVLALLGVGVFFVGPQFGINILKEPFDAETVSGEILLEVGASNVTTGPLCAGVSQFIGSITDNFSCQRNRYSASEARKRIDNIMAKYDVEPTSDWSIDVAGYGRNYLSRADDSYTFQTMTVLVSNDIVVVSY